MNNRSTEFITLVSGLPRSGTSMMMQMVEAGGIPAITDNIRQADDDNPQGYFEFEAVKRTKTDSNWLNGACGKVVKVIYMLLYDLPNDYKYKVVFMNRDIEEVLASQRKMLERRGQGGANVSAEQMKRIFSGQLAKIRDWLDSRSNFAVQYTNYQDIVADPVAESNRINEFLGGDLDVSKMAAAVSSKLYRQRRES